jgi:plasmid stabilization system protein ParE
VAYKINWSKYALADLEAIVRYIANDSDVYAADMAARIVSPVDYLENFPTIGRHLPNSDDEQIREVIAPPYRIL